VLIWNKTATKKIPAISIGRRVLYNTNCVQDGFGNTNVEDTLQTTFSSTGIPCSSQVNEDFVESWDFTQPTVAADGWADVTKAGLPASEPAAAFGESAKRFKLQDTPVTTGVA
jgi:hypothetical protein